MEGHECVLTNQDCLQNPKVWKVSCLLGKLKDFTPMNGSVGREELAFIAQVIITVKSALGENIKNAKQGTCCAIYIEIF